ncbi:hypothetical protein [Arthrobacter alkaliphilus]|uniref:hypothetical protein n=1 Tax=Arthrobacter alkaliphilus TaxID=369936 RepID=UPI001F33ECFF|nr:hypothetical protein [Arthrobacter alkaliphilus]
MIVADEGGVVVVPWHIAAEVAAAAEQIPSLEDSRREAIRSSSGPAPMYEKQLRGAGYTIH